MSYSYILFHFITAPGSPTIRPTPSTAQPTTTPTTDPYPTRTLLSFNCSLVCGSIDAFSFLDDPRISVAFVSAFASVMNITDSAVSVLTVTDFGETVHSEMRRLGSSNVYGTNNDVYKDTHHHLLDSAVVVTLKIYVVLEMLGYTTTQGSVAYNTLTNRAGISITGGVFTTTLSEELTILGSTATILPTITSFKTNPYTTTLIQTLSPTPAPTTSPKISSSSGGISVVDIIVIVSVLGSVTLLAGLVYGAYKEKQMKLQAQSKVAPLNTTSIVTA